MANHWRDKPLKIEGYIIGHNLVIKDPRRLGNAADRNGLWLVLPAYDGNALVRASEAEIAVSNIPNPGLFPVESKSIEKPRERYRG